MRRRGLGDVESDAIATVTADVTQDPALNAIRAISVPMGLLRQQINAELSMVANADPNSPAIDWTQLGTDLAQMTTYTQQLSGEIQAFKSSPSYVADAQTAAELDNWLAFAQDWLGQVAQTVAALPADVADYLSNMLNHAGTAALFGLAPWVLGAVALGALALYGTRQAERTRTYRRYVA